MMVQAASKDAPPSESRDLIVLFVIHASIRTWHIRLVEIIQGSPPYYAIWVGRVLPEEVTFVLSYGSTCCIEQSYIFLVLALLRKHAGSWYHFLCGIVTGKQYRYLE